MLHCNLFCQTKNIIHLMSSERYHVYMLVELRFLWRKFHYTWF